MQQKQREMFEKLRNMQDEVPIWTVAGEAQNDKWFPLRFGCSIDVAVNSIMRLIAFMDVLWIPVLLGFGRVTPLRNASHDPTVQMLEFVSFFVYFCGACLTLVTSVVVIDSGDEYIDQSTILDRKLRKKEFWLDVFSLPGHFWWLGKRWHFLCICRFLRAWRLPSSASVAYDLAAGKVLPLWKELVECLGAVWLMAHILGCGWLIVITWEYEDISELFDLNADYFDKGTVSQYYQCFCFGSAMLVGWAGPTPTNPTGELNDLETKFWIVSAPWSSIYMGFIFAKLLAILERSSQGVARHTETMEKIGSVLTSLNVPGALRQRILQYHTYLSVHNVNKTSYDIVFDGLSTNLQVEVKLFLFENLVLTAPFFSIVPPHLVMKMIIAFEEEVYSPGDTIIRKGETGNELYFIIKGACDVLIDDDATIVVATKVVGDYFGEVALVIEGTKRMAWIRARVFCVLARLTRSVFLETLRESPDVMQNVMIAIKDKLPDAMKNKSPSVHEGGTEMTPLLGAGSPDKSIRQQFSEKIMDSGSARKRVIEGVTEGVQSALQAQFYDFQCRQKKMMSDMETMSAAIARIEQSRKL